MRKQRGRVEMRGDRRKDEERGRKEVIFYSTFNLIDFTSV